MKKNTFLCQVLIIGLIWLGVGAARLYALEPVTHIVQAGENLFRISLRYGVTVQALMETNGLSDPNRVYVGQQLIIPQGASGELPPAPQPAPEPPSVEPGAQVHVVGPGENLYRIGLRYGVTAQALAWANGLPNTNLVYVGQRLVIPTAGAAPPSSTPALSPPAPSAQGKQIVVVLSEQRLYAYQDGVLVRTSIVSTGLPSWPTVTGDYRIYLKYPSQLMYGPGYYLPNVPYVMYFYKGYSLHGTYWHTNFGQPMSHGCVNLPTDQAAWLYEWAPLDTLVSVKP